MNETAIRKVVRTAYGAYETKDRAAIESVLADDFHFTSPLDNRLDRGTYLEVCWPNSKLIERFEIVNLVIAGEKAFVTYEAYSSGNPAFRNTEILTIRHGKIVEVEVYVGWSLPHEAASGAHIDKP